MVPEKTRPLVTNGDTQVGNFGLMHPLDLSCLKVDRGDYAVVYAVGRGLDVLAIEQRHIHSPDGISCGLIHINDIS